ncbi:MAG: cell division protein FtsQ/DivIB [Emergencia sp.]
MSDQYEDITFKEIGRKKKVRKKKHYLLRLTIFVGIVAAVGLFLSSGLFDVKEINVEGNIYYSDDEVITLAGAKTGVNLFYGVGDSEIKDKLSKDPYFAEVHIKRKLPSAITIEVEERRQTAAIVYGDNYVIIDKVGTVLRKSDIDPKITLLTGLTISKMNVGDQVKIEEASTLNTTLQMIDSMEEGDFYFKKIDVSGIVIRAYIYDTLLVKGTAKQMMQAIETGNLQKVINNLLENETVRGTVSLGDHGYMSFSPDFA